MEALHCQYGESQNYSNAHNTSTYIYSAQSTLLNHIIKNIQIGHFSLKPLITPFGECGGTGGQKLKIHQIEKFFFLNDRETYYINIKMWLCFLKSLITPFGERGGRGGSKVENSPNWKILHNSLTLSCRLTCSRRFLCLHMHKVPGNMCLDKRTG